MGTDSYTYAYGPGGAPHAVYEITVNSVLHSYSYDANGNMTAGPDFTNPAQAATRTISYNADNMPTQVTHSVNGTTHFVYDGDGARAKKTNGTVVSYYIGGHYEIIDGVATKYIFAGDVRVAMIKAGTTNYYHKDHLGSSTAMSDENGVLVETTEHTPFGSVRVQTGTQASNYNFTDQELDPETGLYFYGARYYDPMIGRFISPDTIVQDFSDPQTLNRYSYARNNPLIYTDPSGHIFGIDDLIIGIGALIGGISAGVQSDWDFEATLTGAFIGGVSAAVGWEVGSWAYNAVGEGTGALLASGVAGGAAGGMTGGGMNSAIYGGNIGEAMLLGAGYGALAGGITMGLINYDVHNSIAAAIGGYVSGWVEGGGKGGLEGALYSFGGTVAHNALIIAGFGSNGAEVPQKGSHEWREMNKRGNTYLTTPDVSIKGYDW